MNLPFTICDLPLVRATEAAANSSPIINRKASIRTGFTLMELMMVVVIIGLMMATGVPAILSVVRQGPLRNAVNNVLEICGSARAQAILQDKTMVVVFHPRLKEVAFNGGGKTVPTHRGHVVNATTFAPSVNIEGLGINGMDFTESDEAFVHFFPNGTSDQMTLVLSSGGNYRKITLEVTTALASVGNVK